MTSLEERLSPPVVTAQCCALCCKCKNEKEQSSWQQQYHHSYHYHHKVGYSSTSHHHQHTEYHQQRTMTGYSNPQGLNCWRYAQTTNYWLSLLRFSTVFQKLEHFQKSLKFRRKAAKWADFFFIVYLFLLVNLPVVIQGGTAPWIISDDDVISKIVKHPGKRVTLNCPISGNDLPITWRKDNEIIDDSWKRFKEHEMSLKISRVEVADSGVYQCEAANGFGGRTVQIHLQVQDDSWKENDRRTIKPQFTTPKLMRVGTKVKHLQSTVRFNCKARGRPQPNIEWYKDGNITHGGYDTSSARKNPQWTLTLRQVSMRDSGHYKCRVWNTAGEITYTYTLRVVGYVDIRPVLLKPHPINTTVRHGESASMQCKVRSASTPTVKWIKGIDTIKDMPNSYSRDKLFRLENKMYLILPNRSARINSRMMRLPDGSYLNKLTINNVKSSDAGNYICLGANTMGYNLRFAYLTVQPRKRLGVGVVDQMRIRKQSTSQTSNTSLLLSIMIPALLSGAIVCALTVYCLCKRERFSSISGVVTNAPNFTTTTTHAAPPSATSQHTATDDCSTSGDDVMDDVHSYSTSYYVPPYHAPPPSQYSRASSIDYRGNDTCTSHRSYYYCDSNGSRHQHIHKHHHSTRNHGNVINVKATMTQH